MKRLSISLPAIALVLALSFSGAAFTSVPAAVCSNGNSITKPPYTGIHVPFVQEKFVYVYYWFWPEDDTFNDYETMSMEIWEMGEYYYPGYVIDDNPMGGTLILKGYMNPNQPHISNPAAFLYVHY